MSLKRLPAAMILTLVLITVPKVAFSHCEIPCGIYHDSLRFEMLAEHIETIEKSIHEIGHLSAEGEKNYNQLVRWVMNKEDHADKFMEVVEQYFMHQRIKPVEPTDAANYEHYVKLVTVSHQMLVTAMKCKQSVDEQNPAELTSLLNEFKTLYFEKK